MAAEDSTIFISAFKPFSGVTLHGVPAHGSAPMNQSHHIIPAYAYHPTAVNPALRRKVKLYYRRVSDRAYFFLDTSPSSHADQPPGDKYPKKGASVMEMSQHPLDDIHTLPHLTQLCQYPQYHFFPPDASLRILRTALICTPYPCLDK